MTTKSTWLNLPVVGVALLMAGCALRMSEFSRTPLRPATAKSDAQAATPSTGTAAPANPSGYTPPQTQTPPQAQPQQPAPQPQSPPPAQSASQPQPAPQTQLPPQAQPPPQAQLPSQSPQSTEKNLQPTLADIKALAQAGFSDSVILNTIRSSHATYSLSSAEINDLKNAGVSARVINYMVNPATEPGTSAVPPPALTPPVEAPSVDTPSPQATTAPVIQPREGDVPQPPPPIAEEVSPPRGSGYVWVPGAWTWRKGNWVWIKGQWVMPPRPSAVWVPGKWEIRRGKGVWVTGHWK